MRQESNSRFIALLLEIPRTGCRFLWLSAALAKEGATVTAVVVARSVQ